ncbi:MAG: DNA mismatch repair protein MutS [Bacteroidetes bacterium]|nr:MAG: DNA mismatch repair protein MutS [Bacteroidota bacterium]
MSLLKYRPAKRGGQNDSETPLMQQYSSIKSKYPDAILLFRIGDFYETFGEDAIKTAATLGITLTKRRNGAAADIELAGFPYHSLDNYLPKLVRGGHRVAICDQLEDPKFAKKIVKRGITELVTPGVSYNDKILDHKANNFLASIHFSSSPSPLPRERGTQAGVAFLDVSTGEFYMAEGTMEYVDKLLQNFKPSEILFQKNKKKQFSEFFGDKFYTYGLDEWIFQEDFSNETLLKHFGTSSLKGFGIENLNMGIVAAGAALHYLAATQHDRVQHIQSISRIEEDHYVWLDKFTVRNLELFWSPNEKAKTLIDVLDTTISPMGSRMMKRWLSMPLKEKQPVEERLNIVDLLLKNQELSEKISLQIQLVGDLERLISKVATGRISPREVAHLKRGLAAIEQIKNAAHPPTPSQREGGQQPRSGSSRAEGEKPGYMMADPLLYKLLKEFVKENRSKPTEAESILWTCLKRKAQDDYHFRQQHIIGKYIADFACLDRQLVIEVDGLIHQLPDNIENDKVRTEWLKEQGFTVIRFKNEEIIGNIEEVLQQVVNRLKSLPSIKDGVQVLPLGKDLGWAAIEKIGEQLNPCLLIRARIEKEIVPDPPPMLNKGKVISDGVNAELDELRKITTSGKDYLVEIQQRESERTGIGSLKVSFNNIFGYYLEVTNTHKHKVPADWIRKQTLSNCERYITEELKQYEEKILGAEGKIATLEAQLFNDLVLSLADYIPPVQLNASLIARLDCLLSFTRTAQKNNYVRPHINDGRILNIKNGRHPVIETQLPVGTEYIANDIYLDNEQQQIIIITGPNMSGKSALLRQTALITIMAQMGSFVPAQHAEIGLVDKIFTRVGASDNISHGESTFMVEMNETASILNNLSDRSLILLDEIGRGTSTYDGISIAWAIAEFLHNHLTKPKTLFATHYHELNEMEKTMPRIKNFNVSVKEAGNKVIFLRKLVPGGSEHSFGIHVAKMAGVPKKVVDRANEILATLEEKAAAPARKGGTPQHPLGRGASGAQGDYQLSFFQLNDPVLSQIKDDILKTDINTLTPVEALMKLNEIKKLIGG